MLYGNGPEFTINSRQFKNTDDAIDILRKEGYETSITVVKPSEANWAINLNGTVVRMSIETVLRLQGARMKASKSIEIGIPVTPHSNTSAVAKAVTDSMEFLQIPLNKLLEIRGVKMKERRLKHPRTD